LFGRCARLTLFLLGAGLAGGALAGSSALETTRLAGRDYVAVRDLARHYDLGPDRSSSASRASYEADGHRLQLQSHRRVIQLDGIDVWLAAPVISARNKLWISELDVLKAIDPVIRSRQFRDRPPLQRVVLDPGHGGRDRGARSRQGQQEKTLTLDLARRIEKRLTAAGVRVSFTRSSDKTLSLAARPKVADAGDADLLVSLHFNSAVVSAHGIETYCLPPAGASSTASDRLRRSDRVWIRANQFDADSVWLAHCVQAALVRSTKASDRGVRRARFQVLREARCPAVLVEAGFLSHGSEAARIATESYRNQLAQAIADGILKYRRSRD